MVKKDKTIVAFSITALIGIILAIPITMWLWNYVIPTVFGLPEISLLETIALLVLANILFKNNNLSK